jgi:hypothetical protein
MAPCVHPTKPKEALGDPKAPFVFQAGMGRQLLRSAGTRAAGEFTCFMVRGFTVQGQTGRVSFEETEGSERYVTCEYTAGSTLIGLRFAHVGHKSRVRRATLQEVHSRLAEAEEAVDREPHIAGILIFLAVVFPPAHRTKCHCAGNIQGAVSAAGAAV